jgi:hypothetical protein
VQNRKHRNSKQVQRDCSDLFQALYFRSRPGCEEEAVIVEVRANALLVLVPKYGMRATLRWRGRDGRIQFPPLAPSGGSSPSPVTDVSADPDAQQLTVTTAASTLQLGLFNRLRVRIEVFESRAHLPSMRVSLLGIQWVKKDGGAPQPMTTSGEEKVNIREAVMRSEAKAANPLNSLPPELLPYKQTPDSDSLYAMFQLFRGLRLTESAVADA